MHKIICNNQQLLSGESPDTADEGWVWEEKDQRDFCRVVLLDLE